MKTKLMLAYVGVWFGIMLLTTSCCRTVHSDPASPTSTRGWQAFSEQGINAVGEFLIKKGQSVENGRLGVELISTIAPRKCSDPGAEQDLFPKAVVRFYAVPSKQTLAEVEIRRSTSTSLHSPVTDYGVNAIFAREINTKDGWVWFELWK